ncbi:MAG: 50S ribosomal protein L23 [Parcubacteria group bacterium]|nr:MAG: 50S ribosomal protein L23 [Parcubacteria group bacterium]
MAVPAEIKAAVKKAPAPKKLASWAQDQQKVSLGQNILSHKVLLRPLISEKSTIGASLNKYVFEVSRGSNKVEIKKAIADIYGVKPLSVNIINEDSHQARFGRHMGKTKKIKKAIVTLKKGQTIKLYEGI